MRKMGRRLSRYFLRNDVEDMPVFRLAIRRLAHMLLFPQLDHAHIAQQAIYLRSREKGHRGIRHIPLVANAKELAGKDDARFERVLYAHNHIVEARSRVKG